MNKICFETALPVWLGGREEEKNLLVGFHAEFKTEKSASTSILLTASTVYRLFCNGKYVGYGPARAAHDYYRVDEWELTKYLASGVNHVAIEVAGYNVPCYAYLDQPSFLQAEIASDTTHILASTNGAGINFKANLLPYRLQECERYSKQRSFSEIYMLSAYYAQWRVEGFSAPLIPVETTTKKLLERRVNYPKFDIIRPLKIVGEGTVEYTDESASFNAEKSSFSESGTGILLDEMKSMKNAEISLVLEEYKEISRIEAYRFKIFEFSCNSTGFIGFKARCAQKSRILLVFDELLLENDVSYMRQSALNVVSCQLSETGEYHFETIEPYVLKYLKIIVLDGECEFDDIYLRELTSPDAENISLSSSDDELNLIFESARQSLRQNAVDIFMDCPGRERAGWIGDTYYTAKAAASLMGNLTIETNQFENYLLPESFPGVPDGALPMCYPSENPNSRYIPPFCFWFIMQLADYQDRGGEKWLIEALEKRVLGVLDYFEKFKNDIGLLENLESWIFIEWSDAAKFTQDVNIPSNLLYLMALGAVKRLYGVEKYESEADELAETIKKKAFNGRFFMDNLVRENGELKTTENQTEICQYLAFAANVATPETQPELWKTLLELDEYPQSDLSPRNVLFGECLRMELLDRYGLTERLLSEIKSTFLPMAKQTGTLWEKFDPMTSCNHGFTAYVGYLLRRHVNGAK